MKRWISASAFALLSSACSPSLVGANEAGGIVNANFNMGQSAAVAKANDHCARYGKVARITGQNEVRNNMRFECVTP